MTDTWDKMADTLDIAVSSEEVEKWFPEVNEEDSPSITVYFKKSRPGGRIPKKGTGQSAGYDLYSRTGGTIPAWKTRMVCFGFKMKNMSKNTCAKIYSRSGLKHRSRIEVEGGPSIIDRDYRGTIRVPFQNKSMDDFTYPAGTRLGQMVFEKYRTVKWKQIDDEFPGDEKEISRRGGFGSTGQ